MQRPKAGRYRGSRNVCFVEMTQQATLFLTRLDLELHSQPISNQTLCYLPKLPASGSSIESWQLVIYISSPIPAIRRTTFRQHFANRPNMLNGGTHSPAPSLQCQIRRLWTSNYSLTNHG